ncbi:MAG TPA: DUF935 family protein [Fibrobacteria bacterium]|nr:DUF935 family protein [Fibrobacteria bacterium]
MSRNPQKRPKTTLQGGAFAESGLDLGVMGSETTVRQLTLAMADLAGLPNPDPILRSEGRSLATYRQMVDGHLSSVMGKRTAAVRARPWILERGKANSRSTARLQSVFDRLPIRKITEQILTALGMGYSVQEVVWQSEGGWLSPAKIKMRPQEWFLFGLRGEARFLDDAGKNEIVPPRKLLISRHRDDYLNPYGRPILSECFWALAFKRGGLRFWMNFVEKFGLPKTVAKVPSAMSKLERTELLISLERMVRAAAAVIPQSGTVELLETKVAGDLPFPPLVTWADAEMSKAWLGETLTTELQGGGSRAAAQVHDGVRADLALDDANLVEAGFNQLIQWIWEANSETGPAPWFSIQMPQDLLQGRVERDQGLFALGVRFSRQYFEETYNIAPEHLESVDASGALGSARAVGGPAFGEPDPGSGEVSLREQLLSELKQSLEGSALQDQAEKLVGPVLKMVSKATSFDEVLEALPGMVDGLDTSAMEDLMARVCTLAEGIGLGTDA